MFKVDSPENGKRTPQLPEPERCRRPYAPPKVKALGQVSVTRGKQPFISELGTLGAAS